MSFESGRRCTIAAVETIVGTSGGRIGSRSLRYRFGGRARHLRRSIYYAAEELAKDPAHADVVPLVENMRRAFREEFGFELPPRNVMEEWKRAKKIVVRERRVTISP